MNAAALAAVLTIIGGALLALQAPTNAMLLPGVGSPVNAALVSFAVGTVFLFVLAIIGRAQPDLALVRPLPWYAWLGGAYGAVLVAALAFAAPRLGVAAAVTLAIAGQVIMAVVIDHFGWLGMARHPVNLPRVAGTALVVVGVVLMRRS